MLLLSAAQKPSGPLLSATKRTTLNRPLTSLQRASLSFTHNFHHPTIYYVNGKSQHSDYNTDVYTPHLRAFLTKRWTTKREIPPKISILRDMGPSY